MKIHGFKTLSEFLLEKEVNTIDDKKVVFLRISEKMSEIDGGKEGRAALLNEAAYKKLFISYSTKNDTGDFVLPKDLPIIYYGGWSPKCSLDFIKKHELILDEMYNQPKYIEMSASKIKFAEMFNGRSWLPKTVFSKEEALNGDVGFPVIAKISDGHAGLGIKKFETKEELKSEPKSFELRGEQRSFDLFSQYIDIEKEYRAVFFQDKCFLVNQRVLTFEDEKSVETKKLNEKIKFIYVNQDFEKIPKDFMSDIQKIADDIQKTVKLDLWALDVVADKDGKLWVLEINSAIGLQADKMCYFYKTVYEDFYGKKLPDKYWEELMKLFISQTYRLFWPTYKKEIESSPWRIDYKQFDEKYPLVKDAVYESIIKETKFQ